MSEIADALRAILALGFGGFLFIVIGGALASSMSTQPMIDLRLWGVIYIIAAILLTVGVVYAAVQSILS
jgi:hypothetical protein